MTTQQKVVVVGGGIGGLCSALWLDSRGYDVTVLERDDTPVPATVDEAWHRWDRSGAPQVRQPHVVLGRFRDVLRRNQPEAYEMLLDAGATEVEFPHLIGDETADYRPEPGDDQLAMVRSRRTTVEWVLRQAAAARDRIHFCGGVRVSGLLAKPGRVPHVTGVRLADGSQLDADFTVVAGGKRNKLPEWFAGIGTRPLPDEGSDSGVVYASRFYRLPAGRDIDPSSLAVVASGFPQGGVFHADNRTFSVSVVLPSQDVEFRRLLLEPGKLERLLRLLPQYEGIADLTSEPISEVAAMGGMANRWRDLVVDDEPVATGIAPVGDALMCTNPAYGMGMSTAAWAVDMLADALDSYGDDPQSVITTYAESVQRELKPWYRESRRRDAANERTATAALAGDGHRDTESASWGRLLPLVQYDAVVLRMFLRTVNLLEPPTAMLENTDVLGRIAELMQIHQRGGQSSGDKLPRRADLIADLADQGADAAKVSIT